MVCFQIKNSNLGKFSGVLDWKNGYILWPLVIFYGHLGYFMTIWYILCSFGTFFPVLVSWTNKNLATLLSAVLLVQQGDQIGPILPIGRLLTFGSFLKITEVGSLNFWNTFFHG
jgi:hypothetical protein